MSWKYGVHETENSKACFNACVFATEDEANRAGAELFSRWYANHHWSTHEVTDKVNYEFPESESRPRSIAAS